MEHSFILLPSFRISPMFNQGHKPGKNRVTDCSHRQACGILVNRYKSQLKKRPRGMRTISWT